jgi:hypothetical protein
MCKVLNARSARKRSSTTQVRKWARSRSCAPAILVCWCAPLARHGDVLVVFDNRR